MNYDSFVRDRLPSADQLPDFRFDRARGEARERAGSLAYRMVTLSDSSRALRRRNGPGDRSADDHDGLEQRRELPGPVSLDLIFHLGFPPRKRASRPPRIYITRRRQRLVRYSPKGNELKSLGIFTTVAHAPNVRSIR